MNLEEVHGSESYKPHMKFSFEFLRIRAFHQTSDPAESHQAVLTERSSSGELMTSWINSKCLFGIQDSGFWRISREPPWRLRFLVLVPCLLASIFAGRIVKATQFDAFICAVIMLNTLVSLCCN